MSGEIVREDVKKYYQPSLLAIVQRFFSHNKTVSAVLLAAKNHQPNRAMMSSCLYDRNRYVVRLIM
jgi:hypothetical protein